MPIDYKKYPKNWKSEIRPRIMARANNTCEFDGCEFKHGQTVWAAKMYKGKTKWFSNEIDAINEALLSGWECEIKPPIVKPIRVVLTIAHLDHDETNHDVKDERLKAACQLCHLRYDAKEKYRRVNGG